MIKSHFTKSTLITLAFHLAAAAVLFSKPLHLNSRFFSRIGKTPSLFLEEENIVILKRNQALDEAFSYFETPSLDSPMMHSNIISSKELETGIEAMPELPDLALSIPEFDEIPLPNLPTPSLAEDSIVLVEPPSLSTLNPSLVAPFMELAPVENLATYKIPLPALSQEHEAPSSFNFIPSQESSGSVAFSTPEIPSPESVDQINPFMGAPMLSVAPSAPIAAPFADFSTKPATPKSIAGIRNNSSLSDYGLPTLQLREWNEFFDVDVKTYAKEEGGFLFSVNVIPKVDLSEYRLKQNYLFLIDRSSSVEKHRYQTAKRAVSRAVAALRPGDSFNIVILDASMTSFSETSQPVTKASHERAEEFLEKQSNSYQGPATDVYVSLSKVLNSRFLEGEAVTAILISDGDSSLKSNQQRKKINNWLEANRDRITLYTATAGLGNNLSSLKMLSLASRGSLLYSDTHAAFPRKLAKLVMDLRYPIAKEMSASLIFPKGSSHIELLPPSSRLPNLFSDHPYVLMGSASKLEDFTLILEGKNKADVFTIKKTISLSKAKLGSRLLLKQWSAEKAHMLFDQYLREGESTVLQQAEKQLGHDTQNSRR